MTYKQSTMPRYQGVHGKGVVGGWIDAKKGTLSGVGTEIEEVVPDNEIWELLLFQARFETDGTNTQRTVRFIIEGPIEGTRIFVDEFTAKDANTITDFLLAQYGFDPGDISVTGGTDASRRALPRKMMLPPGTTISTETENIQSGDEFTDITMLVERFSTS